MAGFFGSPPKTVESGCGLRVSGLGFRYSIWFSSLTCTRGNCLSRVSKACYKNLFDFIRMNYQLTYARLAFSPAGGMFFKGGTPSVPPFKTSFPPFRIGRLVLDRNSTAERGSGGEVEMILNDKTNLYYPETTNGFCPLIIERF